MTKIKLAKKIIKNHFLDLERNQRKFVPGKSKIPLAFPPYDAKEVCEALDSMMRLKTTMGNKVRKFESEFAKYVRTKYSIMVNSGSSANLLALSILTNPYLGNKRIKIGDEVITPAVTWPTTVYPISNVGAVPKFVDVNLDDFSINVDEIENSITKKTKAVMLVHLLGNPCDMRKIKKIVKKHNLWLIEDACEAHGAKYYQKYVGSFGDLSTFSFFASHHITTMEGGMVLTNNKALYELGKSLRTFGWVRDLSSRKTLEKKYQKIDPRFLFVNMGYNFRPTELQGAFGIHQIKKLENLVKIRIKNATFWNKKLSPYEEFLILPKLKKHYRKSFLFYPLTVNKNNYFTKQELVNRLEKVGIETRPVMAGNILEQPVSKIIKFRKNSKLKNAQYIMRHSFLIGNHHRIKESEREFIANTIINFINKKT